MEWLGHLTEPTFYAQPLQPDKGGRLGRKADLCPEIQRLLE
ncbi:hypothetical protein MAE02_67690 [Microvirga aerophila]|uniref:Uncharacterized protein n=1 Tax=Microvirga aerophila TaxID=670291 RepID=A0A512C4E0_9HYPH|nr:hypothetical protein MAE02_67690 [Microvirga aerophila]